MPRLRSQKEQSAAPPAIVPSRYGLISITFFTVPDAAMYKCHVQVRRGPAAVPLSDQSFPLFHDAGSHARFAVKKTHPFSASVLGTRSGYVEPTKRTRLPPSRRLYFTLSRANPSRINPTLFSTSLSANKGLFRLNANNS